MKKDKNDKKEKELEEKVEQLENTSRTMKVLLMVLAGIVLCACCFGAGYLGRGLANFEDKVTNEDKEEEKEDVNDKEESDEKDTTTEEIELEKLDVNSTVVKELFEVFREDNYDKNGVWSASSDYSDFEKKMYIAYLSIDESEFVSKKCGDLDATYAFDKADFIYHCGTNFSDKAETYYAKQDWNNFGKELVNNQVLTISSAKLRSAYEKIYGINSSYKDENLSVHFNHFLYYNKSSDLYAKFTCQCGGEMGVMNQTIDNVVQNGTNLIIETTLTGYEDEKTKINYTFEYEKETGNYIFVSRVEK